jgi:hypothetical protein
MGAKSKASARNRIDSFSERGLRKPWSAHFPSDVFLGGTLAYVIGRYVVLRNAEELAGHK